MPSAQSSSQNQNFVSLSTNRMIRMIAKLECLKYFVNGCLWKQLLASNLPRPLEI